MLQESRIARVLLALVSALGVLCLALVVWIVGWGGRARLEDLSVKERLALIEEVDRAFPPVYRQFPFSGSPGFYHMVPGTKYENAFGSTFATDSLGFRAPVDRPPGARRLVVAGDSWTFGPYVPPDQTWSAQLERLLNRGEERWQVYSLSMPGWNAENQLAALRQLLPVLGPDLVVPCPTPNDIDDPFAVRDGRVVTQGFTTSAIFRNSFLTESRWVEALEALDDEMDRIESRGVPTLAYFIADWEGLPPYYAKLASFRHRYVVQPDWLGERFRLPPDVDPGEHPTVEGHAMLAAYLLNALVAAGFVDAEPVPLDHEVDFPGHAYDSGAAAAAFERARDNAARIIGPNLYPIDPEMMLDRGIYAVAIPHESETVRVTLRPIDQDWLYPLEVEIRLEADEPVVRVVRLDRFVEDGPFVDLPIPESLRNRDFVDVLLRPSRTVLDPWRGLSVSMRHPRIEPAPGARP